MREDIGDCEWVAVLRRKDNALALELLVRQYLPLVSRACQLLSVEPEGERRLTTATFRTLFLRGKRLRRRVFLPGWLVRTAVYAAGGKGAANQPQVSNSGLWLRALVTLPVALSDSLIAAVLYRGDDVAAADRLGISVARFRRRLGKGRRRLGKRGRSLKLSSGDREAGRELDDLHPEGLVVAETDVDAIAQLAYEPPGSEDLVKQALKSWAWFRWKRRLRLLGSCFAVILLMLATLEGGLAWAWQTGYLMAWVVPLAAKQVLAEAPELGEPAKPWPETGPLILASTDERADLFGLTNVWRLDLRFSHDDWQGLKPRRIRPVPLFSEDGGLVLRNPNAKRSGLAGVLGMEFEWVTAEATLGGVVFTNIAARYRGNGTYIGSLYGNKQSIKLDLNKYAQGQKLHGLDKLNFNNLIEDPSFMHDALGYALFCASGVVSPRTAYAWLTVDVPEKWERKPFGLYLMLENVDQRFAKDRFDTKKVPIFKPVTPDLFMDLGDAWDDYAGIYDLKTEATEAQLAQVIDFAHSLTHDDEKTFNARVGEFVDLDQSARFLASIVLVASYDGFLSNGQNFYMYLDPVSNKFGFIPWDLDLAWGDFPFVGTPDQRDRASIWQPWVGRHRFLERMMEVSEFRALYSGHLEVMLRDHFRLDLLGPRIDAIAATIGELVSLDSDFRWRRFQEAVTDDFGAPPVRTETAIRPVNNMKRFIAARAESVQAQLRGEREGVRLPPMTMGPAGK